MHPHVGIILVTYNRSDVTNLALDSLLRARNERARFKLFLVDNNSQIIEFERIERFVSYLRRRHALSAVVVRNGENLGYAAGNNVGIELALKDPLLSHLCLLNNDVIVTDGWLDRLVDHAAGGLVGPVSNSVGNEQLIPVPYQSKGYNGYTTLEVQKFAKDWSAAHRDNLVDSRMLGFFCVLGERRLFEAVGPLDERFKRGFFEDDDYCLRCRDAGFSLRILREVFVHHWGSASFSQLPTAEYSELFARNRQLFEEKHGITWQQPTLGCWQRALVQELKWLTAQGVDEAQQAETIKTWTLQLGHLGATGGVQPLNVRLKTDVLEVLSRVNPRIPAAIPPLRQFLGKARYGLKSPVRAARSLTDRVYNLGVELGMPERPPPLRRARLGSRGLILIGPIQGYFGRRQRPQHLAEGLARAGFEVYWIEPKPSPKLHLEPQSSGVTLIEVPFVDFANFYTTGLTPREAQDLLAMLRMRLFGARLREASLLLQSPFWAELARAFAGTAIYDCMDYHAGFGSATLEVEMLETQLLHDASWVLVSSDYLAHRLCEHDAGLNDKLHIVRNGCSPNDFLRSPRATPKGPAVVGYFGAVAEWFDHELLVGAARLLPEVRFDIIGDSFYSQLGKMQLPPNIRLLGEQPYHKLPQLTADWSAALIPFLITELIVATNPVKLYEYSALGLPVVATPIPEVVQADIAVFIGQNAAEFAQQIQAAIASNSAAAIAARRRFAEANSWSFRVKILQRLFAPTAPHHPQSATTAAAPAAPA